MYQIIIFVLLQGNYVTGFDLNSIGRLVCFNETQEYCNQSFIEACPELSKSVTGGADADTYMLLYTRRNTENPEKLHLCAGRLPNNTHFDANNQLIVIFMPFIVSFCDVAVYREWVVQLLKREDCNVIVIDYGWGNRVDYATATLNARGIVAKQVVILLQNIQEQTHIPNNFITFIGHSLGAQLAGIIGNTIHVWRIIGLDPAGPGFDKAKTNQTDRLDESDADLVEVWHCNRGDCLPNLGINYDAGHVNFYINGGRVQKSCYKYAFISLLKRDYIYGFGTLLSSTTCWHAQCAQYFKVSINPKDCQFVGVKCKNEEHYRLGRCRSCGPNGENCLIMGYDTRMHIDEIPSSPQKYYVKTTDDCPYCDCAYVQLQGYSETYQSSLQTNEYKK